MDWSSPTRRTGWACLALGLWLLQAVGAGASEGAATAEDDGYRIGPGDVIEVTVWREPDLSGRYTVAAGGALAHVLVGPVPAAGATLAELRSRLAERLERDYLREARLGVSLVESARRKASVLGAVASPGLYPLREGMRVLELLFAAGGVTEDVGARAILKRFDPEQVAAGTHVSSQPRLKIRIDLEALLRRGDFRQNVPVASGDVLVVERAASRQADEPEEMGRVRVVGEVERPGTYSLEEAATALDAVLVAGGLTKYASGNRAKLVRRAESKRQSARLRLDDVLEGDPEAENPTLLDGDMIVVPESFF